MKNDILDRKAIYDASELGLPKMVLLGIQHTFAMFGATVLVPLLTGLVVRFPRRLPDCCAHAGR